MKRIFLFFILTCCIALVQAQRKTPDLAAKEEEMKPFANAMVHAEETAERFRADSSFTRLLVSALREPYSFYYPFDSIQTVSWLYAPDSSFRIFTWQLVIEPGSQRRHGAIQMNSKEGSLKLFRLIDKSGVIDEAETKVTDNDDWIGALYYKLIQTKYNNKNYYTLFGYDENNIRSTKKRLEVLTFNVEGKPQFGGPYFSYEEDKPRKPTEYRFSMEYKKGGNGSIRFDDDLDMIIFDHLISESNEPAKKFTYVPDGDYEGFKWKNGKWVHINKVFDFKLEDGQAPIVKPFTENKLNQRSSPKGKKNK